MDKLGKRPSVRKEFASTLSAQAVGTLITIISGPTIARLVGPVPFGIYSPVLSMVNVGQFCSESGLSWHTLTAKDLTPEEAKDLHIRSVVLSVFVGVAAAGGAAAIGHVPTDQRIFRGITAFVLIVLAGLNAIPFAWARRHGATGKVSWWTVIFSGMSTAIAIPLGIFHLGLAAVVSNNMLIPLLNPVYSWRISGLAGVKRKRADVSLKYRYAALGAAFTYFLSSGADSFVLASYLNNEMLGIYTRVMILGALPGNLVATALQKVGVAHIAKATDRETRLKFVWKGMLLTAVGFALLIVPALLGVNWPGIVFGGKFRVSNLTFELMCGASALTFLGTILSTYNTARRLYGPVTIPMLCQGCISLGGFIFFKPERFEALGALLFIGALVGITVNFVLTFFVWPENEIRDSSEELEEPGANPTTAS